MTNPDGNGDPFPILHRHCLPRTAAEISQAHEQVQLFNLSIDPATDRPKREAAKTRLSLLATSGGAPYGYWILKVSDWYSRHPDVTPVPLSQNLPRPLPLPRRPSPEPPPPDSLFSGQA